MSVQNNNHHVAEKIANLEKEKRELSEKLKREMENADKMKKNNNDASVAKVGFFGIVTFYTLGRPLSRDVLQIIVDMFHWPLG